MAYVIAILSVSKLAAFFCRVTFRPLLKQATQKIARRLTEAFFFYSKCKYTLGIFFWDSLFRLHAQSLNLQDLRREAPASLEALFESPGSA